MKVLVVECCYPDCAAKFQEVIAEMEQKGIAVRRADICRRHLLFDNGDEYLFVVIGWDDEGIERIMGISKAYDEVRSYRTKGSSRFELYVMLRPLNKVLSFP